MKNFNQKGSKNSIAKEKRYSKSKFKNEAKAENSAQKTEVAAEKKVLNKATNLADLFYRNKYEENAKKSSMTFRGTGKLKVVILTDATKQVKGFSVLPKGQCVMVEAESLSDNVSLDRLLKVRANDGRVGLADTCDVKRLSLAV